MRYAAVLLLVAAELIGIAHAQDNVSAWEFRQSYVLTTAYDALQSERGSLSSPDRQGWVLFASKFSLRCRSKWCRELTLVARPWVGGLTGNATESRDLRLRDVYDNPTLRFQEAYFTMKPLNSLSIGGGKQVMGWGPGILYSPTNRLFGETMFSSQQREVEGRKMLWIAWDVPSTSMRVSAIAARPDRDRIEPAPRQPDFYMVRAEYLGSGESAVNAGVVAGGSKAYCTYVGGYAQALIAGDWTIGAETSLSSGYAKAPAIWVGLPGIPAPSRTTGDVLVNARYGLSSGGEIGAEFVWNGFAMDRRYYPAIRGLYPMLLAATVNGMPFHPLLESRYYVVHLRLPRLPPARRVTVLSSLTYAQPGNGALWFVALSHSTNHVNIFGSFSQAFGSEESTLRYPFSRTYRVGVSYSL